nr:hypothetical protein [uncultured Lichenicoccus sp.]
MGSQSVIGSDVRIFRGWPDPQQLNQDMAARVCDVSVYSIPGGSRDTSRYPRTWCTLPIAAPTLTVTSSGNVVTFGGTPGAAQLASLSAANIGYSYAVQASDTLASIASALASAVNADGRLVATATGPSVTITTTGGNGKTAIGYANSTGTAWRETRRQEQRMMVSIWCPTPELRDLLGGAIDNGFSDVDFIDAGDPTTTRIRYFGTSETDSGTNATLYRRDINFLVEYPTIQTQTSAPMVFGVGTLEDGADSTFGTLLPTTNGQGIGSGFHIGTTPIGGLPASSGIGAFGIGVSPIGGTPTPNAIGTGLKIGLSPIGVS